jgi:transposase-like protein
MYSQEQRSEAVRLFIESGKSYSAVTSARGLGDTWFLSYKLVRRTTSHKEASSCDILPV